MAADLILTNDGVQFANGSIQARAVAPVPVRQTVLSGPVDTNGFSAFGGSTGSTTVTATGTLRPTAANGFDATGQLDYEGAIVNPSWTGLSTNGTMYLYLDIAANGTCTTGSTTLAPTYRWGGADVTTSGQFTFNIQEMVGKVGNGATAVQTYRVFVGEVTVAGSVTTAITWYALQGRFTSDISTAFAASAAFSKNHNLGLMPGFARVTLYCSTAANGFSIGDEFDITGVFNATGAISCAVQVDKLGIYTQCGTGSPQAFTKNSSSSAGVTPANYKVKFYAQRGW